MNRSLVKALQRRLRRGGPQAKAAAIAVVPLLSRLRDEGVDSADQGGAVALGELVDLTCPPSLGG